MDMYTQVNGEQSKSFSIDCHPLMYISSIYFVFNDLPDVVQICIRVESVNDPNESDLNDTIIVGSFKNMTST